MCPWFLVVLASAQFGTRSSGNARRDRVTRLDHPRCRECPGPWAQHDRCDRKTCVARDQCYTGSVANLTIAVDDDLLRRARLRALEAGTSVNALLRSYLESFVGDESMAKRQAIVANADRVATTVGPRTWSRDDLHTREDA